MSDATRFPNRRRRPLSKLFAIAAACAVGSPVIANDHIVISEVCAAPTAAEFIEIYNPLNFEVDLSNYYLADNPLYSRTSTQFGTPAINDFIVRFPSGATIGPGARKVVAFNAADFFTTFGFHADFKMPPNDFTTPPLVMLPAWGGSVGAGRGITDAGEGIILFYWDGMYDIVWDVDIVRVGQPSAGDDLQSKSGLGFDGPDRDDQPTFYLNEVITMPVMTLNAGAGFSYKRRFLEGTTEQQCGGNGLTGHQEMSENIAITWDGSGSNAFTAPTPATGPNLSAPPGQCFADINHDLVVNVTDLLAVIGAWGACVDCNKCEADIAPATCLDCVVNVTDLLTVIGQWGPCPSL